MRIKFPQCTKNTHTIKKEYIKSNIFVLNMALAMHLTQSQLCKTTFKEKKMQNNQNQTQQNFNKSKKADSLTFNRNVIEGKWNEIKGEIQKAWGRLTDDEIEKTKGDLKALQGLVQQKYGFVQEDVQQRCSEIYQRFAEAKDQAVNSAKEKFKS